MSNSVADIVNQLRACNFEHVRAVIEPDDNMVLLDYFESQGFKPPVPELDIFNGTAPVGTAAAAEVEAEVAAEEVEPKKPKAKAKAATKGVSKKK